MLLSELVRSKALGSIKVVADACQVFWASAEYVDEDSGVRCSFFDQVFESFHRVPMRLSSADLARAPPSTGPRQQRQDLLADAP